MVTKRNDEKEDVLFKAISKMILEIFLIILASLAVLYFRACYMGKSITKMYWKKNKRNSTILSLCTSMKEGFQPTFWARNPHIQTLLSFAGHFTNHKFNFDKQCIQLRDGGTISLDWYNKTTVNSTPKDNAAVIKPLLVISGCTLGPDLEDICMLASEHGYQPVVYNSRGKEIPLTSKQLPAYLDAADFSRAIDFLHAENPFSDIFAVGYSLGSAPILGYIGLKGRSSLITSSVFISTTLDLESLLNDGLKMPYHYAITESFKEQILSNSCLQSSIDMAEVQSGKSLREIFERAHSVTHPYDSYREYINMNNPLSCAKHIRSPALFINALDDPVIDDQIPAYLTLRNNPYCLEVVTETGGHCGFATGFQASSWASEVAIEFHNAVSKCRILLVSPVKNGFARLRSETR